MRSARGARRPAFTLVELLVGSIVTSLVAAAGATFVSAVSNAAVQTRDLRGSKSTGRYVLAQIVRSVREARGIGQVTSTGITLWLQDTNGDDKMNLSEMGTIYYDNAAARVIYEYMEPSTSPITTVSTAEFADLSLLRTKMAGASRQRVVWAEDVTGLTFAGYPGNMQTRVVNCRVTVGSNLGAVTFNGSASPRASADYLFYSDTQSPPPPGSTRKARRHFSRWSGFTDVTNAAALSFL